MLSCLVLQVYAFSHPAPTEATVKSKLWASAFVRFGCCGYTPLRSTSRFLFLLLTTISDQDLLQQEDNSWMDDCFFWSAHWLFCRCWLVSPSFPLMVEIERGVMMKVWNDIDNSCEKWTVRTLGCTLTWHLLSVISGSFASSLLCAIWILGFQCVCMCETMTKAY